MNTPTAPERTATMTTNTATQPVSLTEESPLREAASEYIDRHGLPNVSDLWLRIDKTDKQGDPELRNPFRRALLAESIEQGAEFLYS